MKNLFFILVKEKEMAKTWTIHEIIIMVILFIGLLNTALTTYMFRKEKRVYLFMTMNTLLFITLFFLVFQQDTMENFFFEVSPSRKRCLMDQVSRKNFGKKMPCSCCQKGTVGGIPPNYAQWLGQSDSDTNAWFRPDHVEYVDTFSNGEECQSFKQPVYIQHI